MNNKAVSLRCFVGLPISDACRTKLTELQRRIKTLLPASRLDRLAWTSPATAHVTLHFLGNIAEDRVRLITEALGAPCFQPWTLRFGGGGFFPDARRPRALWAGLAEGGPETAALAGQLKCALAEAGFPIENRAFRPHLTIARVKRDQRSDWSPVQAVLDGFVWPEMTVNKVVLWRSELRPEGAAHFLLAERTCKC